MKQYLIDFFKYNDWANRKLLESIRQLPDNVEAVKLFNHLIAAQNKWLNRITKEKDDDAIAWFDKMIPADQLETVWGDGINNWINFLEKCEDSDLETEVSFQRPGNEKKYSVKIRDLVLQINYHSIHHRAQINVIIRKQGFEPPKTDYIMTVLKEL
jgi:uncharacterized damage-inducible protein DinB